jgi:predicted RNase H-like HicB family nuclease
MDRILVLWKKDGDVYRAYAPRYPQCTAEGSSVEEVEEKIKTMLEEHLHTEGNGEPHAFIIGEDRRRNDLRMDEWGLLSEEMLLELDPAMLEVVDELNRRVSPDMTDTEVSEQLNSILIEEERRGRKWYSLQEIVAEFDRDERGNRSSREGPA